MGMQTPGEVDMQVQTRAEGGCTGHGPGHGRTAREAGASPGERARDVKNDVAPLAKATGEVTGA
jgi:hypothetical protein